MELEGILLGDKYLQLQNRWKEPEKGRRTRGSAREGLREQSAIRTQCHGAAENEASDKPGGLATGNRL